MMFGFLSPFVITPSRQLFATAATARVDSVLLARRLSRWGWDGDVDVGDLAEGVELGGDLGLVANDYDT